MTKTEILAMFVAKNDPRKYLLKPFRIGPCVYASNGHWIVRLPSDRLEADPIAGDFQNRVKAMFDTAPTDGFVPLPKVEDPGACYYCNGHGVGVSHKCDCCDGNGTFERGDHEYECRSCDGEGHIFSADKTGTAVCPHCSGLGVNDTRSRTEVGNAMYADRYLWLLRNLPCIEISPCGKDNPARIRFDGGDGLLMPYRG